MTDCSLWNSLYNLLQALNRGIWHEGRCKILSVVLLVIFPLLIVLSLSCTENSAMAILDFHATDSEVFLETWWGFKTSSVCWDWCSPSCLMMNPGLNYFRATLWKGKGSQSASVVEETLFVITSWLVFEMVWLCRCLINVFGGIEHTYEEWMDKATLSSIRSSPGWSLCLHEQVIFVYLRKRKKEISKIREYW